MEIDEAQNLGTSLISLLMLMLWRSMIIKIFIKKINGSWHLKSKLSKNLYNSFVGFTMQINLIRFTEGILDI